MSGQTQTQTRRVVTPTARLSFPALFEPKAMEEGGKAQYSCELIFEKGADLTALKAAAREAMEAKWPDPKNRPKNIKSPFRDGSDREGKKGYENCTFIGARSKDKPQVVVGPNRAECTNQSDVYGGCYVRASVTAFAYDQAGNRGVSFALNNVWKIKDGEPFGNRRTAEQDFEDVEMDAEAFGGDEDENSLY